MRIVITGGAGFIGSNLTMALQEKHPGVALTVVDDFSSADFKNLRGFRGDVIAMPCEELNFVDSFRGEEITVVYHLASITDTTVSDQRLMIERNVEGFRNVLALAAAANAQLVYASSGATYGQADGVMREDQEPAPANVYGFSKVILDNLARDAAIAGLTTVGVRYFNVYGPHEAHKGKMSSMVYQLYKQIRAGGNPKVFRAGEHRRDFVYVKDAVAGTMLAGESETSGVFNIGSGTATSFNEVIETLAGAMGVDARSEYIDNPYEAFYQHHTEADLSSARAVLGYNPQWLPADGITDYVAWLDANDA